MNGNNLNWADWTALVLVIVGALNWGLVGIGMFMNTNLNLVNILFGFSETLEALVYLIVGLSGLWAMYTAYKAGQLT